MGKNILTKCGTLLYTLYGPPARAKWQNLDTKTQNAAFQTSPKAPSQAWPTSTTPT